GPPSVRSPRLQSGRNIPPGWACQSRFPLGSSLGHGVGFAVAEASVRPPREEQNQVVRAAADRVFLPTKSLLEQVGDMMILTGKTLVSAIRPPYPYGTEFVQQFL